MAARNQDSGPSARPIMTHGKEVEFLCRYVVQPKVEGLSGDETIRRMRETYPEFVVLPWLDEDEITEDDVDAEIDRVMTGDYTRTLELNGVDVSPTQGILAPGQATAAHPNAQYTDLSANYRWTIEEDESVQPTANEFNQEPPRPEDIIFRWYGLELISPATPNTPESHQDMALALRVLKEKYGGCMSVNATCGLHVHVAMGPKAIPLSQLRRIAAFLYAADPLLAILHPHHRQENHYCSSIRRHANVSWGMTAAEASVRFRPHDDDDDGAVCDDVEDRQGGREQPPRKVEEAVAELLRCDSTYAVGRLLQYGSRKCNYNFAHYRSWPRPPAGSVSVEFRQHEGTLDPARIEAWARLCVGLTDWAAWDMTDADLARVVALADAAEWALANVDNGGAIVQVITVPEVAEILRKGLRGVLELTGQVENGLAVQRLAGVDVDQLVTSALTRVDD